VTPYGNVTIGSTITGSGGLTKTANGTLVLTAANTYTGKTCVATGCLQVGDGKAVAAKLGDGDVEVANGAVLRVKAKVTNAVSDGATVALCNAGSAFYGMLDLDSEVNETVGALVLEGKAQPAGTYGGKESKAEHKLENYFSGAGILTVTGKAAPAKP
jgi:fibronectin-binding autotransporter adhesin